MKTDLQFQWHIVVVGFLGLVVVGSFLVFTDDGARSGLPEIVGLFLAFGGCPAVVLLTGTVLYFGVRGDLYRSLPAEEQPELDTRWVAVYMLIFYALLIFSCVMFQRLVCVQVQYWDWG